MKTKPKNIEQTQKPIQNEMKNRNDFLMPNENVRFFSAFTCLSNLKRIERREHGEKMNLN